MYILLQKNFYSSVILLTRKMHTSSHISLLLSPGWTSFTYFFDMKLPVRYSWWSGIEYWKFQTYSQYSEPATTGDLIRILDQAAVESKMNNVETWNLINSPRKPNRTPKRSQKISSPPFGSAWVLVTTNWLLRWKVNVSEPQCIKFSL